MAVDKIFDELGKMSVLELVELKNKIEEEWGVTAAAPMAVANRISPSISRRLPRMARRCISISGCPRMAAG